MGKPTLNRANQVNFGKRVRPSHGANASPVADEEHLSPGAIAAENYKNTNQKLKAFLAKRETTSHPRTWRAK